MATHPIVGLCAESVMCCSKCLGFAYPMRYLEKILSSQAFFPWQAHLMYPTFSSKYSAMLRPIRSSMMTLSALCFFARRMVCFSPRSSSNNTVKAVSTSSSTGRIQLSRVRSGTIIHPPSAHSSMTAFATCILPNIFGSMSN